MSTFLPAEISPDLRPPAEARTKLGQLQGKRSLLQTNREMKAAELDKLAAYLGIADAVDNALDTLGEELFGRTAKILEEKLTQALQEVLEQPMVLKVNRDFKRGGATISFHVERNGNAEDIMKGQGGSVINILSVGLRMFALTTLDPAVHRRFLVLDEQDCWLRPALVPHLVKIVHEAGRALGFQVLMISHHDVSCFQQYAEKIYEFNPTPNGVQVSERVSVPLNPDE